MKKVGIITYYNALNNGAFLQAYSMQLFLRNKGFDPYIVNTSVNFEHNHSDDVKRMEWLSNYDSVLKESHKLLPITDNKNFDACIYGSDEIWNLNSYGENSIFWGYRLKAPIKISYAACSACSVNFKYFLLNIKKTLMATCGLLFKFNAISVRDVQTKQMVYFLSKRKTVECLDPTFLVDFSFLQQNKSRNYDYIVIYSYGLNEKTIAKIKNFAEKNKCKIIYTGSYCDWADENPVLNPLDWVNLLYHAKYVITSTFHGTVFSIICKRDFFVVDTKSTKVKYLLSRLQISNRNVDNFSKIPSKIDYTQVYRCIDKLKKISENYILSNI